MKNLSKNTVANRRAAAKCIQVVGGLLLTVATFEHALAESRQIALVSRVDASDLHPDIREIAVECALDFDTGGGSRSRVERIPISAATRGYFGLVTNRILYDTEDQGTPVAWRCNLRLIVGGDLADPVLNGSDDRTRAVGTLEAERSGSMPPP